MTDTTAPKLDGWAADMAAADLEPFDGAITLDADDKPFVRLHFAFATGMDDTDREGFLMKLSQVVLRNL
jgi:hypothetical protein